MMFGDRHITFGEANESACAYSAGFAARGLQKGDVVAILMENSADYVLVTLGLAKLGVAFVTVNTAYKGEFLRHVLGSSQASVVVVDEHLVARIEAIRAD